ncbi:hypothetical protein [Geminocystis herdmanii]|nr:hypothetical protein [Geminocystis herdmanii]
MPVGDEAGQYQDENGQKAQREDGLDDRGLIYRLTDESIFIYWDTAPYQ